MFIDEDVNTIRGCYQSIYPYVGKVWILISCLVCYQLPVREVILRNTNAVLIAVAASPHASIKTSNTNALIGRLCRISNTTCSAGETQKLTKETQKHPTKVRTLTNPGTPTLIATVRKQMPKRTRTLVR